MEIDAPLSDQVRQQFALLAPQPGTPLAQALDRACELIDDEQRVNDHSWNSWMDDQRLLEDSQEEIRMLRSQLAGIPIKDEEESHAA